MADIAQALRQAMCDDEREAVGYPVSPLVQEVSKSTVPRSANAPNLLRARGMQTPARYYIISPQTPNPHDPSHWHSISPESPERLRGGGDESRSGLAVHMELRTTAKEGREGGDQRHVNGGCPAI